MSFLKKDQVEGQSSLSPAKIHSRVEQVDRKAVSPMRTKGTLLRDSVSTFDQINAHPSIMSVGYDASISNKAKVA